MATANLNSEGASVDTGNDSIVIVLNIETIPGGRTLYVTEFTQDVIKAGHIIIEDIATKELKPMPVDAAGTAYDTLPANHAYKGVLVASILKTKPFASIMVRGTVNEKAFENGGGFATPAQAKKDLVLIRFTQD